MKGECSRTTISAVIQLIIKVAVDVLLSSILCPLNQWLLAEVINNLLTGNLIMFEVVHVMLTHYRINMHQPMVSGCGVYCVWVSTTCIGCCWCPSASLQCRIGLLLCIGSSCVSSVCLLNPSVIAYADHMVGFATVCNELLSWIAASPSPWLNH